MDSSGVYDLTDKINSAIPCAGYKKLTKVLSLSLFPPGEADLVLNEQKLIFQTEIEFSCTSNGKVSLGSGGMMLRTYLSLKTLEVSSPVDINWWTNQYVITSFNQSKFNVVFSDIHF